MFQKNPNHTNGKPTNGYGAINEERKEEGKRKDSDPEDQEMHPFVPSQQNPNRYKQDSRRKWLVLLLLGVSAGLLLGALITRFFYQFSESGSRSAPVASASSSETEVGRKEGGKVSDEDRFDYIIVGGGPSGILAATKLAKKLPDARVLLIESGTVSQAAVLKSLAKAEGEEMQQDHQNRKPPKKQHTATVAAQDGIVMGDEIFPESMESFELNKYDIPLFWPGVATMQRRTEQTFKLAPDPNKTAFWPIPLALLARGLGGCGLHYAMINMRALPSCFEQWNLTHDGVEDENLWTFEQMLPVYKDLETYATTGRKVPHFRGDKGPLHTQMAGPETDEIGDYFIRSAQAKGVPLAANGFNHPNATDRVGVGYYEFHIRNGMRHSVVQAMLGNEKNIPSNLEIMLGRTVTEILWNSDSDATANVSWTLNSNALVEETRAIGVEYLDTAQGNIRKEIRLKDKSTSEVILATGAIMTPQILWNSGIGENGTVVDLPGVGKNLQDHPVLGMAYEVSPEMTKDSPQMYAVAEQMEDYTMAVNVLNHLEKLRNASHFGESVPEIGREESLRRNEEFATRELGILGTAGFSTGAFLRSPWAEKVGGEIAPDIQLTVFPRVVEPHQPTGKNKVDERLMRSRAMLVTVSLLQPEARYQVRPSDMNIYPSNGTVKEYNRKVTAPHSTGAPKGDDIASTFAKKMKYALPSIDLPDDKIEYLTDFDVQRLAWGMKQVRDIVRMPPMSSFIEREMYPGDSVSNDETLNDYVRVNHLANSHWVGSTKMGNDDDTMAVLDQRLRVRHVKGLRVFDSGAIPRVPNGNIHNTICAVASRGVDLILDELPGSNSQKKNQFEESDNEN